MEYCMSVKFEELYDSSVQLLSRVQLFVTPWTAAPQAYDLSRDEF